MVRMRRNLLGPLGHLLSLAIFAAVVWKAGPAHLLAAFGSVGPPLLLLGAAIAIVGWVFSTLKWQMVLRELGATPSFLRLLALNVTAQLWGLLLPAQIGGEIYRGGFLVGGKIPLPLVASAAVIDRGSSIMATALVGVAAAIAQGTGDMASPIVVGMAAVAAFPIFSYALLHGPRSRRLQVAATRRLLRSELATAVDAAVAWLVLRPWRLAVFVGLGMVSQVMFALQVTVWAHGISVQVTLPQIAAALAASALLPYLVPVPGTTVAVQQGAFVYLLVHMGITADHAAAVALTSLVLVLLLGFAGAGLQAALAFGGKYTAVVPR